MGNGSYLGALLLAVHVAIVSEVLFGLHEVGRDLLIVPVDIASDIKLNVPSVGTILSNLLIDATRTCSSINEL